MFKPPPTHPLLSRASSSNSRGRGASLRIVLYGSGGCVALLALIQVIIQYWQQHISYPRPAVPPEISLAAAIASSQPSKKNGSISHRQEEIACRYGGYLMKEGTQMTCICGKGTSGRFCEEILLASLVSSVVDQYNVCANCWAITPWYATPSFHLEPIQRDEHKEMLQDLLVWKDGGEVRRGGDSKHAEMMMDEELMDVIASLGPWSEMDKHMIERLAAFRNNHRKGGGLVKGITAEGRPVGEEEEEERGQQPKKESPPVRIVYGLMLHNNLPRFKALWRVLFDEGHFYVLHIDRGVKGGRNPTDRDGIYEDPHVMRQGVIDIINETPCCRKGGKVWDRVVLVDEEDSVDSTWGTISLVYNEVLLWLALLRQSWDKWQYFICLSGADIPVMSHANMSQFLATKVPHSYIYHHENKDEFRQKYMMPYKESEEEGPIVFSALEKNFAPGKYRERIGITRLRGNSQWHVLHRGLLTRFITRIEIVGLLFSYKHSAIPDESFFSTAAIWLANQYPGLIKIEGVDLRYWNEGCNRDLSAYGELYEISQAAQRSDILFARKSKTAIITCAYTNKLLGLQHNCSEFAGTGRFPDDALSQHPPQRPSNWTWDMWVEPVR